MNEEKCCWNCIYDDSKKAYEEPCASCRNHSNFKTYKPTNYDRIRNMSVEEMSENIFNIFQRTRCMLPVECEGRITETKCKNCIKQYLESEVDTE